MVDILKLNIEQDFETKVRSILPKDPGGNILVTYLSKMWYLWTKNMKGATVQKVVLKTFEGQGLSGLCATFQLAQMLTKIQLHNLDQTSANIVILLIWSKRNKRITSRVL